MIADTLLGAEEIAAFIHVDVVTVYRLHRTGRLPTHKVGGQIRLRKATYLAWIEEQERANAKGVTLPPLPLFDRAAE